MSFALTPALLDALGALAVCAGEATLRFYEGDSGVETKADGSPVTKADLASEAVILPGLARLAPGVPVVSEESADSAPATGDLFFLVDPLDGTKEFISRNGEFTVNIALIENGAPVLGVVQAPALGRLWIGAAGLGAWEIGADGARRALKTRPAPAALTAIGSRSHGGAETARWLERLNVENFVAAGSSLKFCLIAAGEADVYPRHGRTMEWDTAAGDAVLRAAGGIVTRFDGTALDYGKRDQAHDSDFANPHFVAFGDAALARKATA
jgi:sulfate adenylyltransferase subunit 2/3'(2'), 5'-bisphosphate nucleotidase